MAILGAILLSHKVQAQENSDTTILPKKLRTEKGYQAKDSADYVKRVVLYKDSVDIREKAFSVAAKKQALLKQQEEIVMPTGVDSLPDIYPKKTFVAAKQDLDKAIKKIQRDNNGIKPEKDSTGESGRFIEATMLGGGDWVSQDTDYNYKTPIESIAPLEDQEFYKQNELAKDTLGVESQTDSLVGKPNPKNQDELLSKVERRTSRNFPRLTEIYQKDKKGESVFQYYEDSTGKKYFGFYDPKPADK